MRTALRSAFEPSRITSRLRSVRRPRLWRFASRLWHTVLFSVEPSQRPNACFWSRLPPRRAPRSGNGRQRGRHRAAARPASRSSSGGACHVSSWALVLATNRRLTALLLVPRLGTAAGSGSKLRAYCRVATPTSICSTTRRSNGSPLGHRLERRQRHFAGRRFGRGAAESRLCARRGPPRCARCQRGSPAAPAHVGVPGATQTRCGPLRASWSGPASPIGSRARAARSACRPADRPTAAGAAGIRLGERNGLCETASWRLLSGEALCLGLSHHSCITSSDGAAAFNFQQLLGHLLVAFRFSLPRRQQGCRSSLSGPWSPGSRRSLCEPRSYWLLLPPLRRIE